MSSFQEHFSSHINQIIIVENLIVVSAIICPFKRRNRSYIQKTSPLFLKCNKVIRRCFSLIPTKYFGELLNLLGRIFVIYRTVRFPESIMKRSVCTVQTKPWISPFSVNPENRYVGLFDQSQL